MVKATKEYTADSLKVLKGLDPVRKRPGFYIGSNDSRGLLHLLWEIVDNSVDEVLAGHGTRVDVTLNKDGSITVSDDGRGIPVGVNKESGLTGIEVAFTQLHGGGKFGGGGYTLSGGLHGVGSAVVNALSTRVDVEVLRDGHQHTLSFQNGIKGQFKGKGFKEGVGIVKTKSSRKGSGTTVTYWSDPRCFEAGAAIDVEIIKHRFKQTSFLIPGITLTLVDNSPTGSGEKITFNAKEGLVDFVKDLTTGELITKVFQLESTSQVKVGGVDRHLRVRIAGVWEQSWEYKLRAFTNGISNPKGGTHVQGFEQALTRVVGGLIREAKVRGMKESASKDDIIEGLVVVVALDLEEPSFTSQTKEELGTPEVKKIVNEIVGVELSKFFSNPRNKGQLKKLISKIANAQKARLAAREQREIVRKKNALEGGALPSKLKDCISGDLEKTELLICEGNSAGGQLVRARDSKYQAVMPIRGKILNAHKAGIAKVLANKEVSGLVTAMGAGVGSNFDLEKIRYGKTLIVADADVDGSHIRCLLITFFWLYMRDYVLGGRLYAAVPPLYILKPQNVKLPLIYAYTEDEKDAIMKQLAKDKIKLREKGGISRLKGLGEMDADELRDTAIKIGNRKLKRITAEDCEAASKIVDTLMGSNVEIRREYILESAKEFDADFLSDA